MGRNTYSVEVQAEDEVISISVPENVTADVAGNRNLPSNVLQVWHCKHSNTCICVIGINLFSFHSCLSIVAYKICYEQNVQILYRQYLQSFRSLQLLHLRQHPSQQDYSLYQQLAFNQKEYSWDHLLLWHIILQETFSYVTLRQSLTVEFFLYSIA